MPKLIRLYITNVAIGFGLAVIFVAMLVAFDIANLRHLVLETEMGWLAAMMMVLFNGVVFAGAQFAIAVMRMADDDTPPHGGRPARLTDLVPVRVTAAQPARRPGVPRR